MLDLRTFEQSNGYCGPASLKIVLDYYGVRKSERALAELCGATRERGTSARGLVSAARKLGFDAYMKTGSSLKELEALSREVPVIVDWCHQSEGGHYSVVAGFNGKDIVLSDPYGGKIVEMPKMEFDSRWYDFYGDRPRQPYIVRRMIVVKRKEN
jgi:ABC-type bacteriocin/lantibiotic exporter with double-glycine peptidase domain